MIEVHTFPVPALECKILSSCVWKQAGSWIAQLCVSINRMKKRKVVIHLPVSDIEGVSGWGADVHATETLRQKKITQETLLSCWRLVTCQQSRPLAAPEGSCAMASLFAGDTTLLTLSPPVFWLCVYSRRTSMSNFSKNSWAKLCMKRTQKWHFFLAEKYLFSPASKH